MQLSRDHLLGAYRRMATIRAFEERLHDEIAKREIAGFTHLYCGQEAAAVGVCGHLDDDDFIVSTHRRHGHFLAKRDGKGKIGLSFSGDGACNQGTTFEAMNMAVVTKAPVLFVFENNHYSEHTGPSYATATATDIAGRAAAFGMKAWRANGCDYF